MRDNIYLITGASSDIGCELIRRLGKESAVIAQYNSQADGLNELVRLGFNNIKMYSVDLACTNSVDDFCFAIESIGIPTHIVHLAAPKVELVRFKDLTVDRMKYELDVQLHSILKILNHFLPIMSKKKYGKVVIMLSSYVLDKPPMALLHYTTTKYALLGLTKSLASEFNAKNITINAISPSMIETKFLSNIDERIVEMNAQNHPLKRNATTDDIVPSIQFLLSDDSKFINGTNIPVTGGLI
jgi:3-oxoacyl-[acyl-carrier protein] reductase